jgi:hypothetical protein
MKPIDDPVAIKKANLAEQLVRFLGTAQAVEEYISPSGYRFKQITRRKTERTA